MKKYRFVFFFLFMFLVFPQYIFAELEHNMIYFLSKLNIQNGKIVMEGYSFISHRDNVGGDNLGTYIVAYTGSWKSGYATQNTCNQSGKCYSKKASQISTDFYNSRCTSDGCYNPIKSEATDRRRSGDFINDSSCADEDSHCIYHNVGFRVSISLSDLANRGLRSNVRFKIVNVINNDHGNTKVASDLGVYRKLCQVNGESGRCSGTIESSGYRLTVGGMNDEGHYDAVSSALYTCGINDDDSCTCNPAIAATAGATYQIDRILKQKCTIYKYSDVTYTDYMLRIDGTNYWAAANRIVTTGNFKITQLESPPPPEPVDASCASLFPSGAGGYTTDNTVNCGNSGSYDQCKSQTITSDTLLLYPSANCTSPKRGQLGAKRMLVDSQNGDFQWVPTDEEGGVPQGATCYVPIVVKANVVFYQTASFNFGTLSPGTIYAGKGFSLSNASYTNSITWAVVGNYKYYTYQNITNTLEAAQDWLWNGTLRKGELKPLQKNADGTLKDVYYYAIDEVDATHPYGKYHTVSIDKAAEAVINATIKHQYRFTGTTGNTNYKLFAVTSPSTNVPSIVSGNVNNISYVSCNSDDISNCSVTSPNQSVAGNWALSNHTEEAITIPLKNSSGTVIANYPGGKITNQYTYSLANSYVSVSGSERATAKYENNAAVNAAGYVATGQKYYISFDWTAGSFPFNLNQNINPSFLSNMDWSLDGTCSVTVKDGLFKEGDDGGGGGLVPTFRYRTIDVKNPFPKKVNGQIAPINWRNWYTGNVNNQNRLTNSYANYPNNPLYKIILSNSGANASVKVSEIKGITTSYVNLDTINPRGTSSFVENYFQRGNGVRAGGTSYCSRGSYRADCDSQT